MTLPILAKAVQMTEGNELLNKADALLAKYRSTPVPDFPVLTDVVDLPAETSADPTESITNLTEPPDVNGRDKDAELELEIRNLEARLRSQLLLAIEPYVANCLDGPLKALIKTLLDEALAHTVAELASKIQVETTALVSDAVTKAVEREIVDFRSELERP